LLKVKNEQSLTTTTVMASRHGFYVDSEASLTFRLGHLNWVVDLEGLSDGSSFVSCSLDDTAKRWLVSSSAVSSLKINNINNKVTNKSNINKQALQDVCTYRGHEHQVMRAVEKDDNTLITAARNGTLKEWNKTSGECLKTVSTGSSTYISSMMILTNKKLNVLMCGLSNGKVELRKLSDIQIVLASTTLHKDYRVNCFCELEDGSFVSGSHDTTMKRWTLEDGKVLGTFSGHCDAVKSIIELKDNIIVSASDDETLKM